MIPITIAIVFILLSFGLFWYIFRNIREDEGNPVWGNLFASFLNIIICLVLAYSFITGNIMDMSIVENASYTVSYPSLDASASALIDPNAVSERQYIIGKSGSGMYTISAIDSMPGISPYLSNFTVSYLTKDIVYIQVQDWGLFFLFGFLACCSAALFLWFCWPILGGLFGWNDNNGEEDGEGNDY